MANSVLCKLLQRRTYDILSHRNSLLFCFLGLVILCISVLRFGEMTLEWSREKYAAVFNYYSDNIGGRSFQNRLCQYVPIDAVYTWVNGTDPKLLAELLRVKEGLILHVNSSVSCSYSHCVPSHLVLVRPSLPSGLVVSDLEEIDLMFSYVSRTFVVESYIGNKKSNLTVLDFGNIDTANIALAKGNFQLNGLNYTMSTGFITDEHHSENMFTLTNVVIMSKVPSEHSVETIMEKLPQDLVTVIENIYVFEERGLAVFILSSSDSLDLVLKYQQNVTFGSKIAKMASAHLVTKLAAENEDISASRFTDNEELRYSLRSLEKNAPWIRQVYIITNGQIPYWLNLDNPRISVVTHEEIFPNKSHLPSYSSPAIETHLHRIPGISKKFIYLNDDVMFGKEVWPEDFYTHSKGQKVYLTWPVPDCADGCPVSWIKDGYCDRACNNSACSWDGGDCTKENVEHQLENHQSLGLGIHQDFSDEVEKMYCNAGCVNQWLADKYCDMACNVKQCSFDVGDCGTSNYNKLFSFILLQEQQFYQLPQGLLNGYFNLSSLFSSVTEGYVDESPVVREVAVSQKYNVLTFVLYPNHNSTNITLSLKGKVNGSVFEVTFTLNVDTTSRNVLIRSTENHDPKHVDEQITEPDITFEEFSDEIRFPKVLEQPGFKMADYSFANMNLSMSEFSLGLKENMTYIQKQLDDGYLTEKGYLKQKAKLIQDYVESLYRIGQPSLSLSVFKKVDQPTETRSYLISDIHKSFNREDTIIKESLPKFKDKTKSHLGQPAVSSKPMNTEERRVQNSINLPDALMVKQHKHLKDNKAVKFRRLMGFEEPAIKFHQGTLPWEKLRIFDSLVKQSEVIDHLYRTSSRKSRRLLDTFADSLRHVNKLYNDFYGSETRKVPAHIAHLIDIDIMNSLQERFPDEFDATSSRKIRSGKDMQFAFSYFYFLISEKQNISIKEIFDRFDTDHSGTWSDREIRTVLTHLYNLPLEYAKIQEFEANIINCSKHLATRYVEVSVPPYERYLDSKLQTVSQYLIEACPPIAELLNKVFGVKQKYDFEVMGEEEVTFKMIGSNLSQVIGQLDQVRKNPTKFICMNDNIRHGTKEAEIVKAVLQDFYEAMFPVTSQFELPSDYRNRFLHLDKLKEWRRFRDIIRLVTYISVFLLLVICGVSYLTPETRRERPNVLRNRSSHWRSFDV
ncbi:N-acetylglucosamine-1-phosphotransferase subunits alpha/beta-like isoform X2 [Tachypleus tridentatus]|uniref:N-acetylglucosamine-1-phosphotransferase subunits alpha/beta-like isoform X2 n=1 Tax=Tachypleus tridentatus TaxID=6853 RepID=UPI003FD182BD